MIRNFSLRQRLHLLLELLYGECDERMRQEIKCSIYIYKDECKTMDMKQTSNCSGFNVTFRPSAFFRRGTLLIYR